MKMCSHTGEFMANKVQSKCLCCGENPWIVKPIRNIPWTALQAFAAFAEDANFTRAAARLHLSQPALHTKGKRWRNHVLLIVS